MHQQEIELFGKAIQLAHDEFYIDAIGHFNELINTFKDSELVDDALYNIGLTYYNINDFDKAIQYFQRVINECPDATISILEGGSEFGRTAAKAYYGLLNCYLAKGDMTGVNSCISSLEAYNDSYIQLDGVRRTYAEMAKKALETFNSIKR